MNDESVSDKESELRLKTREEQLNEKEKQLQELEKELKHREEQFLIRVEELKKEVKRRVDEKEKLKRWEDDLRKAHALINQRIQGLNEREQRLKLYELQLKEQESKIIKELNKARSTGNTERTAAGETDITEKIRLEQRVRELENLISQRDNEIEKLKEKNLEIIANINDEQRRISLKEQELTMKLKMLSEKGVVLDEKECPFCGSINSWDAKNCKMCDSTL